MKFYVWNTQPISLNVNRVYQGPTGIGKPKGFWFDADADWKRWCESENFGNHDVCQEVVLSNTSNILLIDTLEKLDMFNYQYAVGKDRYRGIQWDLVYHNYDGIIIAPYQYQRRMTLNWYFAWDCASGCVWNLWAISLSEPLSVHPTPDYQYES